MTTIKVVKIEWIIKSEQGITKCISTYTIKHNLRKQVLFYF